MIQFKLVVATLALLFILYQMFKEVYSIFKPEGLGNPLPAKPKYQKYERYLVYSKTELAAAGKICQLCTTEPDECDPASLMEFKMTRRMTGACPNFTGAPVWKGGTAKIDIKYED